MRTSTVGRITTLGLLVFGLIGLLGLGQGATGEPSASDHHGFTRPIGNSPLAAPWFFLVKSTFLLSGESFTTMPRYLCFIRRGPGSRRA